MSAAREAGDCDVRALARALAADVIAVRCLPAWPVADAALLRLVGVAAGTRGLGAPDAATRQARPAPAPGRLEAGALRRGDAAGVRVEGRGVCTLQRAPASGWPCLTLMRQNV